MRSDVVNDYDVMSPPDMSIAPVVEASQAVDLVPKCDPERVKNEMAVARPWPNQKASKSLPNVSKVAMTALVGDSEKMEKESASNHLNPCHCHALSRDPSRPASHFHP